MVMFELQSTLVFDQWLRALRELRVHHGPGYRVYVAQRGKTLLILLCGGDKSTQVRDIEKAHVLLNTYDEG